MNGEAISPIILGHVLHSYEVADLNSEVEEHGGHVCMCCEENAVPSFVRGLVDGCRTRWCDVILAEFSRYLCSLVFRSKMAS